MTDQRDEATKEPDSGVAAQQAAKPPAISRRMLMRGASVALPTILTLNSNAAFGWAVTSGTIGTRPASSTATGDATCVIGAENPAGSGVYSVSTSDFYTVRSDYEYRTGTGGSGTLLNPEQACQHTGDLYYRANGTGPSTQKRALGGAVASLTQPGALASFGANVHPTDWPL